MVFEKGIQSFHPKLSQKHVQKSSSCHEKPQNLSTNYLGFFVVFKCSLSVLALSKFIRRWSEPSIVA